MAKGWVGPVGGQWTEGGKGQVQLNLWIPVLRTSRGKRQKKRRDSKKGGALRGIFALSQFSYHFASQLKCRRLKARSLDPFCQTSYAQQPSQSPDALTAFPGIPRLDFLVPGKIEEQSTTRIGHLDLARSPSALVRTDNFRKALTDAADCFKGMNSLFLSGTHQRIPASLCSLLSALAGWGPLVLSLIRVFSRVSLLDSFCSSVVRTCYSLIRQDCPVARRGSALKYRKFSSKRKSGLPISCGIFLGF
jgi:hypothetical protein